MSRYGSFWEELLVKKRKEKKQELEKEIVFGFNLDL